MADVRFRARFMEFIGELQALCELQVVFTFRRFASYFESIYLDKQLTGEGLAKHARPANARTAERWLSKLFESLNELRDVAGQENIVVRAVDGMDSIAVFLSALHIPLESPPVTRRRNERIGLKKTSFLHRLRYTQNGDRIGSLAQKEFRQICSSIQKLPDFPGEVYRYRVMPNDQANEIQLMARGHLLPPFLLRQLPEIVSPRT